MPSFAKRLKNPPQLARPEVLERRDCPATISIVGGTEVLEGGQASLQVVLSEPLAVPASVTISMAGSSAGPADYLMAPRLNRNLLTFLPGETVKNLTVRTTADILREPTERILVSLTRPINCVVDTASAAVTILDDDSYAVAMSGPSSAVAEGDHALISLTLSSPATKPELFRIVTRAESATANRDFRAVNATVRIPRGGTSAAISIPILRDSLFEGPETFLVQAVAGVRGTPSPPPVRVTIAATTPAPSISVTDTMVTEGNFGTTAAHFVISLSAPSPTPVTVNYATANGTATSSNTDYTPASGTLAFAPGETQKTVSVVVFGDTMPEPDEAFSLLLSSPVNASLARSQATATIRNDDMAQVPVTISLADISILEGNSGTTPAVFTVSLSAASSTPVTVNYATANGTATSGDNDYTPVSGTLSFLPGETQKTVSVVVLGDAKVEQDEAFYLALSSPVNASLARSQATATIRNDDAAQSIGSWTVMVYMTGDNLNSEARNDINEMEWALTQLPASVNIVVAWDQPATLPGIPLWSTGNGTQPAWSSFGRAKLLADSFPDADLWSPTNPNPSRNRIVSPFELFPGDKNSGDPAVLADFLRWGAQQAPAQRYLLMMWGHGGGLIGSNNDPEIPSGDELTIPEMAQALASPGVPTFDIVGYDNCVMGMTEIAYAFSPYVRGHFVGSQEDVPGYGHDYTTVFSALTVDPWTASTEAVAVGIVQSFNVQRSQKLLDPTWSNQAFKSTYSAIRSSSMPILAAHLRDLVNAARELSGFQRTILRMWVQPVHTYGGKTFADLGQFLTYVSNEPSLSASFRSSAYQALLTLNTAVVARTLDPRNSSGLSIYLRADGFFDFRYTSDAPQFISATDWAAFISWLNSST